MFKHRKQQEKKHRTGEIPTGSFSDIAFLLIIYFILATTLIKVQAISADMPAGEQQAQQQADETPTVNLRGQQIFFGENEVEIPELDERLRVLELASKPPEQRVIMLESAPDTPYQVYFEVMATISANGGVVAIVEEEE